MERRNLLKGLAAGVAAITGGIGTTVAIGAATDQASTQLIPADDAKPVGPPDALDEYAHLLTECTAELKHYFDVNYGQACPRTLQLPFATVPANLYVRQPNEESVKTEALQHLAVLAHYPDAPFESLLRQLVRRTWATATAAVMTDDAIVCPYLAKQAGRPAPNRLLSPRYCIDVSELNGPRLATMFGSVLLDVAKPMADFPRLDLAQGYGDFDVSGKRIYKLITPLRLDVSQTGPILESFGYAEVFACFSNDEEEIVRLLSAVAPMLNLKAVKNLATLDGDLIQKDVVAHREKAAMIHERPGFKLNKAVDSLLAELGGK